MRAGDHVPLQGVRGAHIAISRGGSAVGVPGTITHANHDRRSGEVAVVLGEMKRQFVIVVVATIERIPHPFEIHPATRGELVALCRLDVHAVKIGEVLTRSQPHLHTGLLRLSDVATPLFVETREHVGERAILQWNAIHIPRLHVPEPGARTRLLLPTTGAQRIHHLARRRGVPIRGNAIQ